MKRFVNRVEKGLMRLVVIGVILMVMVQALMTREEYRIFLSWGEKLEGQSINYPVTATKQAERENSASPTKSTQTLMNISIDMFSSLPKAIVLVNGKQAGNFSDREISLKLKGGDVVEIDSRYYNFPINYKITSTSDNLAYPGQGKEYTGNQSIVMIGKVIVK
ncbi:MAG: hypothetical protein ABFC94_08005 [Syntrophomonas sp.]